MRVLLFMGNNLLNVGDIVPFFTLNSFNCGVIDLKSFIQTQKTTLIFSRYFGCPICQLDLNELLQRQGEITTKGAKIVYITQSSVQIANEIIHSKDIKFPVIQSSRSELYAQYGLGLLSLSSITQIPVKLKKAKDAGIEHGPKEGWEQQSPGQFLLDTTGKIIHFKKGWLDVDDILTNL
jgi:peroxiredoxin